MPENDKSLDIFGTKPIADAVKTVTDGSMKGMSALLSRICLPAAEELGLYFKERVSTWRAENATKITAKANAILETNPDFKLLSAHPKIAYKTIDDGSWTDDDIVLSLWAGLLASSCTISGKDESNLIFINLLSQLTSSEVRLIKYSCENAKVFQSTSGWIVSGELKLEAQDLSIITNVSDLHQLDRELDHLRTLGLIQNGFNVNSMEADITPTPYCLQLYVRSQGYVGSPIAFFETLGPVETYKSPYDDDFNEDYRNFLNEHDNQK